MRKVIFNFTVPDSIILHFKNQLQAKRYADKLAKEINNLRNNE